MIKKIGLVIQAQLENTHDHKHWFYLAIHKKVKKVTEIVFNQLRLPRGQCRWAQSKSQLACICCIKTPCWYSSFTSSLQRPGGHGEPLHQHPTIKIILEKGFSCIFYPLNKIMVIVFQSKISIIEFVSFAASWGFCSERRKFKKGGLDPWVVAPHRYKWMHKIRGKIVKN